MMVPAERIIGNEATVAFLMRAAESGSLGHAYLLLGPDGVGKRLAALAFARAVNCKCDGGAEKCESCRLMDSLSHPEMLLLEDVQKPRWLRREAVARVLEAGPDGWRERYHEAIAGLEAKGYLREPLPRADRDVATDGFVINTDELFGKGSVPSKECYTPRQVSDRIRREYDRGDVSEDEYRLLTLLYEYPLSKLPYRGAIPIAYVTTRQGWKFTRPIQSFLAMTATMDGKKIVIVDDAEKLTPEAQNCLLKTLEEPPPDSVLILVTSDVRALFPTIVSRCQTVTFGRLTETEVGTAVEELVGYEDDDVRLSALLSGNSPGRLLELSVAGVRSALEAIGDAFGAISEGRPEAVFALSAALLREAGSHRRTQRQAVRQALELVVFWIAEILRVQRGLPDTVPVPALGKALAGQARLLDGDALLESTRTIEKALERSRWNVDMTLLLEATLLDVALNTSDTGTGAGARKLQ
jgi:DNA polymerase III delta prime subunit